MTPEAAAWIRRHVLPAAYRRHTGPSTCPCQWGRCGHCQRGRHAECPKRTWHRHGQPSPDTWITSPNGMIAAAWAAVWRATGPACRWICPCDCPPELHPDLPPPVRREAGGNTAALLETTPRRLRAPDQDTIPGLD